MFGIDWEHHWLRSCLLYIGDLQNKKEGSQKSYFMDMFKVKI